MVLPLLLLIPGFLQAQDAKTVLADAAKAMGAENLRILSPNLPNRAPRAGLCVLHVACRAGWRLPFCAPWRDVLPGWSRSSPRIAISAASDPSVDTPDSGAWAMTAASETRNGARIHCIHIHKSAYGLIRAEWFPES